MAQPRPLHDLARRDERLVLRRGASTDAVAGATDVERRRELARRGEAVLGPLGQADGDRVLERLRDAGAQRLERSRVLANDRRQRLGRRRAREGAAAREHLVGDQPEGELVRTKVHGPSGGLLRRHVAHGPEDRAGPGRVRSDSSSRSATRLLGRVSAVRRARPKSRILARPSAVTMTFSGLRSRCTTPLACAAARPSAIWRAS